MQIIQIRSAKSLGNIAACFISMAVILLSVLFPFITATARQRPERKNPVPPAPRVPAVVDAPLTGVKFPLRELTSLSGKSPTDVITALRAKQDVNVIVVRVLDNSPREDAKSTVPARREGDRQAEEAVSKALRGDTRGTAAMAIAWEEPLMQEVPIASRSKCLILVAESVATDDLLHEYGHCLIDAEQRKLDKDFRTLYLDSDDEYNNAIELVLNHYSGAGEHDPKLVQDALEKWVRFATYFRRNLESSLAQELDLSYLFLQNRKALKLSREAIDAHRNVCNENSRMMGGRFKEFTRVFIGMNKYGTIYKGFSQVPQQPLNNLNKVKEWHEAFFNKMSSYGKNADRLLKEIQD